jgi:nucleoside 2-deoxyribosyltransferase
LIAIQFIWPDEQELRQEVLLAIKEACKSNGYEADVVNQDHTGNVSDQIISDIKKSRFVVAELTYNNRGVYFEAGFSRGLGLPVFHLVRNGHIDGEDKEGKKVHFDIQQLMYRKWTNPEELKNGLKSWIAATVGPYEVK